MAEQHVQSDLTAAAELAGLTAKRTALALANLKLFKSDFTPTRDSVVGDFAAAEADFTGYAAVALSWSAVGIGADLRPTIISTRAFFQATDAVTPNEIGGAWLETAAGALYEYWVFITPISLSDALAYIGAVVTGQYPDADDLDADY